MQWLWEIENGKITIPEKERFVEAVKMFSGNVRVTIDNNKGTRSSRQNRYLWGVVYKLLSDQTGYVDEEIHEICKVKFNMKKYDLPNEEHIEAGGSTTKLTTEEFNSYCENIRRWAAQDLNCVIPEPGQTDFL